MNLLTRPVAQTYPLEGDLTHSSAGRQYSDVVDRMLERNHASGQILVTSAGRGEGKTVTAVNLALALHARRIPVLLVEFSVTRPKFHAIFGESPMPRGVEDVLAGRASLQSVVLKRADNNLHLAMVKRAEVDEESLAPSAHLDQLLADARRDFQWTIFDGVPIEASTHMHTLIGSIGGSLLVARARQTKRSSFAAAFSRISEFQPMVLLNDEHPVGRKWYSFDLPSRPRIHLDSGDKQQMFSKAGEVSITTGQAPTHGK